MPNEKKQTKNLIEGCQSGDSKAQQKLFEQYFGFLLGVCLRYTSDREEAKDMLQEGFVKIFNNIHKFNYSGQLENWMKKIMVNTAIDRYRKKMHDPYIQDIESVTNEPYEQEKAYQNLSQEELLKVIQTLPPGYRTVFNLCAIEGYSHKEIAQQFGINEGTSKSQLAKARKMLQDKLKSYLTSLENE